MNKQQYQLRFSSFSSYINFQKTIVNKNQNNCSDEDFDLMSDIPKEVPVIAQVKNFLINNISL